MILIIKFQIFKVFLIISPSSKQTNVNYIESLLADVGVHNRDA